MCTVLLPPGDNPTVLNKYIIFVGEKSGRIDSKGKKSLYDTQICLHVIVPLVLYLLFRKGTTLFVLTAATNTS